MGGRSSSSGKSSIVNNNVKIANLDPNDVFNPQGYFSGTNQQVSTDLSKWVSDADESITGYGRAVGLYVANSSVNDRIMNNSVTLNDRTLIDSLDSWIGNSKLSKDTILYSGLSEEKIKLFNSKKSVTVKSYTSTSPDPVYAFGYSQSSKIPTLLKVHAKKGSKVGKTYYEGTSTTEGILGRNSTFNNIRKKVGKIGGNKVNIIEVDLY